MNKGSTLLAAGCLCLWSALPGGRGLEAADGLAAGKGSAAENLEVVDIPLTLSADEPVQGFVMVLEWWDCYAEGVDLRVNNGPGQLLESAQLVQTRVEKDFMIFTAVMDIDGEGAEVIPAGQDQRIGTAQIRCICPGSEQEVTINLPPLSTRSMVDGGPVLQNMIVSGGLSIGPGEGLALTRGSLVCNAGGSVVEEPRVTCGTTDDQGNLLPAQAAVGETVPVCFFYQAPEPETPQAGIQGFSVSVQFDCNLTGNEDAVSTANSVLESLEAEFLQVHVDNDPDDGDGCELIAGMLIDASPPVDGRTLPGAADPGLLFCVDFTVGEGAACGESLPVDFVDGLDGRGQVPTQNLVSIRFFEQPWKPTACSVEVVGSQASFQRGDCNFNRAVNVADVAAIVGYLFLEGENGFDPPCLDACDSNDTGGIDITDAVYLLNWLFVPGSPVPPAPGPITAGADETDDDLGCAAGGRECP